MICLIDSKGVLDIEQCFLRCIANYEACISAEENEYLKDDIEESIDKLVLKNDSVKIFIESDMYGESVLDIRVNLFSSTSSKLIGHYRYIESFAGEALDDYLDFL